MDYINKIKTIASGTMIAMAACTTVAIMAADKISTNSQNITCITEETSSDDGSAPGTQASVVGVNTNFVQSATLAFDCTIETENETQILAEAETMIGAVVEPLTEQVVGQPEIETTEETSKIEETTEETTTVQETTTEVVEEETTESSTIAQGNESNHISDSEFVLNFSEEDYQVLCTIVEAEAGDQDAKGRILVANVIINRVNKGGMFGNTIKEVVFAKKGNTYQFSPTKPGGRYYRVTPSELTIECVDRALRGEDYSQGALYFCMKTSPNSWFNTRLQFLFKHQDHYFYK